MSDFGVSFDFSLDKKSIQALGKLPSVRAGILKDQKLWSWKREIRSLGGGLKGNKIQQGKQWGDETVGSSLASVFTGTPLLKEFEVLVNKKAGILFSDLISNAASEKRAANSFAALLVQAYAKMSKKRRNSKKRAEQKGFNAYAIGTGQTIKSIRAEVVK